MMNNIRATVKKLKTYALPVVLSVMGGLAFVTAPVSIGLIALTPLVPVLTGSALAIIAFRQYGSQSEILMGNNSEDDHADTAIGVGYTQILMCSLIFTTLGYLSPLLGPVAPYIIPTWYATIAVTALSALCAGGYKKLRQDWGQAPIKLLNMPIKVVDSITSLIPFRMRLKGFFAALHEKLGKLYFAIQVGLFMTLTLFSPPLGIIGVAGISVLSISFIRAMNYLDVRLATFIERTSIWIGICAGLFITNPVLQVYTAYTLASIAILEIATFLGSKLFNSNAKTVTEEKIITKETPALIYSQMPTFKPLKELICGHDVAPTIASTALNVDLLMAAATKLRLQYQAKYKSLEKDQFYSLKTSSSLIDHCKYYLQYIPQHVRWLVARTPKATIAEHVYIEKAQDYFLNLRIYGAHRSELVVGYERYLSAHYKQQYRVNAYLAYERTSTQFYALKNADLFSRVRYYAMYLPMSVYLSAISVEKPPITEEKFVNNALKIRDKLAVAANKEPMQVLDFLSAFDDKKPLHEQDALMLKAIEDKRAFEEMMGQECIEAEAIRVAEQFKEYYAADYAKYLAKYAEFGALKNAASILGRIKYYMLYVPVNIKWYVTRFFHVAKLPNDFANDKISQNTFAVTNAHFSMTPPPIPILGNIAAFDVQAAVDLIMQHFPKDSFYVDEDQKLYSAELENLMRAKKSITAYNATVDAFERCFANDAQFRSFVKSLASYPNAVMMQLPFNDINSIAIANDYKSDITVLTGNKQDFLKLMNDRRLKALLVQDQVRHHEIFAVLQEAVVEKINIAIEDINQALEALNAGSTPDGMDKVSWPSLNALRNGVAISVEIKELLVLVERAISHINTINDVSVDALRTKQHTTFQQKLESFMQKLKTGKGLAMDKSAQSVRKMQMMGIEVVEFLCRGMQDPETRDTSIAIMSTLIADTDGRCAQAPFTDLKKAYNNLVLGAKIREMVAQKKYGAKDLIAIHLQAMRHQMVDALIAYLDGNKLIKSIFFHMSFMNHHDNSYIKKALRSLNLESDSDLHNDLSTDTIDLLKEIGSRSMAFGVKRIFMLFNTLYSPDSIINWMYRDLRNRALNKIQGTFEEGPILAPFSALACLELWLAQIGNPSLQAKLAEIMLNLVDENDTANEQAAKSLLATMLMDQGVLEYTQAGLQEAATQIHAKHKLAASSVFSDLDAIFAHQLREKSVAARAARQDAINAVHLARKHEQKAALRSFQRLAAEQNAPEAIAALKRFEPLLYLQTLQSLQRQDRETRPIEHNDTARKKMDLL